MKDLTLTELSDPVRDFLASVDLEEGALIRDQHGRAIFNIVRCRETSPQQRARAFEELRMIQKQVGDRLRSEGVTEEEFDRIVLEGY
jgi:hypothetical protein